MRRGKNTLAAILALAGAMGALVAIAPQGIAGQPASVKDKVFCYCNVTPAGPVLGAVSAYPQGGPLFTGQLADAVLLNPGLARDVVCVYSVKDNVLQAQAGRALAAAQLMTSRKNPQAGDEIAALVVCGSPLFQSGYYNEQVAGKELHTRAPYVPDDHGGSAVSNSRP